MKRLGVTAAGVVLLIAVVQVISVSGVAGATWPSMSGILDFLRAPGSGDLVLSALASTASSAWWGFAIGSAVATALSALSAIATQLRPGLTTLVGVLHAIPIVAIAPLLITVVGPDTTPTVLAALAVGFVVFVAATSAQSDAEQATDDWFSTLGASRWQRYLRLQAPRSIPSILDGMTLAVPAAVLGAVFGEWFGASEGIGVLLVSQMQNFQMNALWASSLITVALSGGAYLVVTALRRYAYGVLT
ncbi:ABC transporter permease subunit [Tsukamurella sp. NPDC003166]|uniref:ABC transporter permease n=1 Tax=Tsukamurella sp. NPDC003166 TaxID=3154444 RepID=UPI0033B3CA38